jgi:hypothetical protein
MFGFAKYITPAVVLLAGYLAYLGVLLFQRARQLFHYRLASNELVPDQIIGWGGLWRLLGIRDDF